MFDHGVYGARHFRGDRGVGLASQMGIVSVPRDHCKMEGIPDRPGSKFKIRPDGQEPR